MAFYRFFSILIFSVYAPSGFSQVIEFPEEELARETVLPVFDKRVVVKNRLVETKGRFEMGGGFGMNLTEALYSTLAFNFSATYHFTEEHGLNFNGILASTSLSSMAKDLQAGKGLTSGTFDASRAPAPEYFVLANYQYTTYYGKISISKTRALNLSVYGLGGLGMVSWTDSVEPAVNVGIGQKLYFNPRFALRTDLQLTSYMGPDPTAPKGGNLEAGGPQLGSGDFDSTLYFRSFLMIGMVILL